MASRPGGMAHKLHAVTLVRSGIGRPWWEKRTLKVLQLERLKQTVVHKNTPAINGQIAAVKNLVKVCPILLHDDDLEGALEAFQAVNLDDVELDGNSTRCKAFLGTDGTFDLHGFLEYHKNVLSNLPKKPKETNLNTDMKKKAGKGRR